MAKFSGTLVGLLRGRKHYFQMEWVDLDTPFEAKETNIILQSLRAADLILSSSPQVQLQIFEKHGNTMVVAALRVLADSKRESD